jgi:hypothetical protein
MATTLEYDEMKKQFRPKPSAMGVYSNENRTACLGFIDVDLASFVSFANSQGFSETVVVDKLTLKDCNWDPEGFIEL